MSINKNRAQSAKTFKFGQLVPRENDYKEGEVSNFELKNLKDAADFKNSLNPEIIRTNRNEESRTNFNIDPRIREHRGLLAQEESDYEQRVAGEVSKRLELLSKEAYEDGLNKGREEGAQRAYDEMISNYHLKIDEFSSLIEELATQRKDILDSSKDEAYKMIKNLTKWVVLKEVEDKDYILRLLEKLILEINTKMNLLIRVNKASFVGMPEVIKAVEEKIGPLTNVRVEIQTDSDQKGIVLESENGIIDASLEAQFKSIDRLFEAVGTDPND